MTIENAKPFLAWFTENDGWIDTNAIDIIELAKEDGSRGVVALTDIPEGHAVFSVPRTLVLSPRISTLRARFGVPVWNARRLHKGWSGLILTMMWEAAQGSQSKWGPFFDVMPKTFETPMFWNEEDLAELQGTSVVDKLGREDAEKDYAEKVLPAIKSRPDLFNPADIDALYSLEIYHIQGSRVLSRSFTLENEDAVEADAEHEHQPGSEDAQDHEPAEEVAANTSVGSAMDVDGEGEGAGENEERSEADSDDQEDAEPGIVVMVPLADMLNARYQSENVKLFYEPTTLKMITTQPIHAGSQIFNTYEDLPNSELLRGFGHVDYLPLPGAQYQGEFGCPGDVAVLRADVLVAALGEGVDEEDLEGRIEWWLEEGGDDAFTLEFPETGEASSIELAPDLLAFLLLIGVAAEWERSKEKGKLPKPLPKATTMRLLLEALRRRTEAYPTTLEEDKKLAENMASMTPNKRHALIVRMGEKRVLELYKTHVSVLLSTLEAEEKSASSKAGKRKAGKHDEGARKNKRRA